MSWWIWLVAAVGLLVAEVLTLSLLPACFALGCVAAALGAGFGLSPLSHLALFCAAVLAGLVFIRPLLLSGKTPPSSKKNTCIGQEAVVIASLAPGAGLGLVRMDGKTWKARPAEAAPLPVGTRVRIVAVEGAVVHVSAILPEESLFA